ncbi:MAG: hypothetical protein ACK41T_02725 [Pseudobdellovibrio sp.]
MRYLFTYLSVLLSLITVSYAQAYSICAGETYEGTLVEIATNTTSTYGKAQDVIISIAQTDGKSRTYTLKTQEIAQYYEYYGNGDAPSIIGLNGYQNMNNPVYIRYIGTNWQDLNLIGILKNPERKKELNNEMRVWKGPGYKADQQYYFKDVVCSVISDI